MYTESHNKLSLYQFLYTDSYNTPSLYQFLCTDSHSTPSIYLTLHSCSFHKMFINTFNGEWNPICRLLELLIAQHLLHVSRISVNAEFVEIGLSIK